MHKPIEKAIAIGAGLGLLWLLNRSASSAAGRGGVPTIPNTNSTYDARTWGAPWGPMVLTSDPLLSSFDARQFRVSALAGYRRDRPLGNFPNYPNG